MKTAGWNSPKQVRAKLQAALYYARKQRLERLKAQQAQPKG